MTEHLHSSYVEGCYRCDLSMDEVPDCWRCAAEEADTISDPLVAALMTGGRMYVCRVCGNKRCPKATDHRLACSDSNEPGQPGSRYA